MKPWSAAPPKSKQSSGASARSNNAWAARYEAQAKAYKNASKSPSKPPTGLSRGQKADADRLTAQYVQSILYPQSIYWNRSGTPVITNDRTPSAAGFAFMGVPPKSLRPIPLVEDASGLPGSSVQTGNEGGYWWGGGGGGGSSGTWTGESEPVPVTWEAFDSGVSGAPSYWKAMKPSVVNDATEYLAGINMLLPFLSSEDQKVIASNLYTQDAKNFGHLNPEAISFLPTTNSVTASTRQMFTDSVRAQQAIAALAALSGAVGKTDKDMGSGYRYLRSILNVGNQFGGNSAAGNSQSRNQYLNMLAALDPLVAQAQTQQLSPYEGIVKMLTSPFFSGGQLRPIMKDSTGKVSFGTPNKSWL